MTSILWSGGKWTNAPASAIVSDGDLLVTAVEGSDAWRLTSYGFVHASEHALVTAFPNESAMEVEFGAEFSAQFDQAGLFVRVSDEHWVKASVEYADGRPQVGAVVTQGRSDWSLAPVPGWLNQRILVRVSRSGDALTIRAGIAGEELQLVRVVPLDPAAVAEAGPFACAPSRAGLVVPFHRWSATSPDSSLH